MKPTVDAASANITSALTFCAVVNGFTVRHE